MTAPILNDRDLALQAAKYRSKQTNLLITGTASAFLASRNSITILPATIVLTATPSGSVFSGSAVYTWSYALSSAPSTFIALGTGKTWTLNNSDSWVKNASVQYRCIISENLLDDAYGYYTVTYSSEGAESNFITLSRTNVVVPCSATGVPTSFNNTDITIAVSRGTTDLDYSTNSTTANSFTVSVADDGNLTRNLVGTYTSTSKSFTMSGISGLALDGATITFTINVYDSSATPVATTYTRKVVYNKVSNGVVGSSARAVDLTIGTQAFAYLSDGTTPSPANTVITATAQNTTGTVYYEFFVAGVSTGTATTTNTYTYTPLAAYASMPEQITVKLREGSNNSTILATDIASIIGIKPGVDSIIGNLTNPSATVIADSSGSIASGTVASGTFLVYDGIVDKTGDTAAVTYSVHSFTTGLSISIAQTGIYSVTGLSVDSGAAILRAIYGGVTINLSFTIAKSKAGVIGASARAVNLTFGTQTFAYLSNGTTPSPANTVLTATAQNTTGTPYYEFFVAGASTGTATTTNTYTYTPRPTYDLMPQQVTVEMREGAANNPVVDTDTASIIGVKPGVDSIVGNLSNPTSTVIGDVYGSVSSFANTSGTFYVYDGVTNKTGDGAVTYSVYSSTGLTISIATNGVYTISAMGTDVIISTAILRAVYKGVTIDLQYTMDKSKPAADGSNINPLANYDFAGATLPSLPTQVTFPGTAATYENGTATLLTNTVADQNLRLTNLNLVPNNSYIISMRVKWISGAWEGLLFYVNSRPAPIAGESGNYYKAIPQPALDVWTTINVDMRALTAGGLDYLTTGNITQLRFDFVNAVNASVAVDYISVGKYGVAEATKSITLSMFRWAKASELPLDFSGAFTYNWNTGAVSAYPTGWDSAAGAATYNLSTLYQRNITLTDTTLAATTNANWSDSSVNTIGYRTDGTIGVQGDSYRIAYYVSTSATAPTTPGPTTVVAPATTTIPSGWLADPKATLVDGEYMYQSDGQLSSNTNIITWGIPYLSNLKVGSLSALSASLGTVNVLTGGSLKSGKANFDDNTTGFFLGFDGGAQKFRINNGTSGLSYNTATGLLSLTGGSIFNASNEALLSATTVASDINNSAVITGGNLCVNSDFTSISNWAYSYHLAGATVGLNLSNAWTLNKGVGEGTGTIYLEQLSATASGYQELGSEPIVVVPGNYYFLSGYSGAHRCTVTLFVYYYDINNNIIGNSIGTNNAQAASGGTTLSGYYRHKEKITVPATFLVNGVPTPPAHLRVYLRKSATITGNSDSYMFVTRVMFEETWVGATEPGAWRIFGGGKVTAAAVSGATTAAGSATTAAGNATTAAGNATTAAGTATTAANNATTAAGTATTAAGNATTAAGNATTAANNATTAANNATTAANNATNALSDKLDRSGAQVMTGPVSLNAANAIVVGTIPSGKTVPDTGLYIGTSGLVGRKSGNNTFVLDASTGDATFRGTVEASTLKSTDNLFVIDLINKTISISV